MAPVRRDPMDRFLAHVRKTDTCWLWTGAIDADGYGKFWAGPRRQRPAHRWLYEQVRGSIPGDLPLDHLCRIRNCVRIDHLEPVTARENIRRSAHSVDNRPACKNGHEFTPQNTRVITTKYGSTRVCRACQRYWQREYQQRRRAHQRLGG